MRAKDVRNRANVYDLVLHEFTRLVQEFVQEDEGSHPLDRWRLEELNRRLIEFREGAGQVSKLGADVPQLSYFLSSEHKLQAYVQGWFWTGAKNMILIGTKTMRGRYYDFYVRKVKGQDHIQVVFGSDPNNIYSCIHTMNYCRILAERDPNSTEVAAVGYQFYEVYLAQKNAPADEVGWVNIGGNEYGRQYDSRLMRLECFYDSTEVEAVPGSRWQFEVDKGYTDPVLVCGEVEALQFDEGDRAWKYLVEEGSPDLSSKQAVPLHQIISLDHVQ